MKLGKRMNCIRLLRIVKKQNSQVVEGKRKSGGLNMVKLSRSCPSELSIVGIHGLYQDRRSLQKVLSASEIREQASSYLVDLRNHGLSEHMSSMSLPEMADDVCSLILEQDLKKVILVGHSLGGRVAMAMLSECPSILARIKGTVIVDIGAHDYWSPPSSFVLSQLAANTRLSQISLFDKPYHKIAQEVLIACENNQKFANNILQSLEQHPSIDNHYRWKINFNAIDASYQDMCQYTPIHNGYEQSLLVLLGQRSEFVPVHHYSSYKQVLPAFDPTHHIQYITNAAHWVHIQNPQEVSQKIAAYLTKVNSQ